MLRRRSWKQIEKLQRHPSLTKEVKVWLKSRRKLLLEKLSLINTLIEKPTMLEGKNGQSQEKEN